VSAGNDDFFPPGSSEPGISGTRRAFATAWATRATPTNQRPAFWDLESPARVTTPASMERWFQSGLPVNPPDAIPEVGYHRLCYLDRQAGLPTHPSRNGDQSRAGNQEPPAGFPFAPDEIG